MPKRYFMHVIFKSRINVTLTPIVMAVAARWGEIQGIAELAGKPMPSIDGLIAVSGLVHHCVVVSRNISDMQQSTAELLNPWLEKDRTTV